MLMMEYLTILQFRKVQANITLDYNFRSSVIQLSAVAIISHVNRLCGLGFLFCSYHFPLKINYWLIIKKTGQTGISIT